MICNAGLARIHNPGRRHFIKCQSYIDQTTGKFSARIMRYWRIHYSYTVEPDLVLDTYTVKMFHERYDSCIVKTKYCFDSAEQANAWAEILVSTVRTMEPESIFKGLPLKDQMILDAIISLAKF